MTRISLEEFKAMMQRAGGEPKKARLDMIKKIDKRGGPAAEWDTQNIGVAKDGRLVPKGQERMNKTEREYYEMLKADKSIIQVEFEGASLKLATGARYTPDFFVVKDPTLSYGSHVELHEVKGFVREPWLVRWKVAKEKYPHFRFLLVRKVKGQWIYE